MLGLPNGEMIIKLSFTKYRLLRRYGAIENDVSSLENQSLKICSLLARMLVNFCNPINMGICITVSHELFSLASTRSNILQVKLDPNFLRLSYCGFGFGSQV